MAMAMTTAAVLAERPAVAARRVESERASEAVGLARLVCRCSPLASWRKTQDRRHAVESRRADAEQSSEACDLGAACMACRYLSVSSSAILPQGSSATWSALSPVRLLLHSPPTASPLPAPSPARPKSHIQYVLPASHLSLP